MRLLQHARKDPLGICLALAALALLLAAALSSPASAHSWYDPDCCSNQDCEPVSAVSFVASDPGTTPVMVVTTSLGTKPLTPATRVRESKDSRMHACIYQGRLLCLYMPPGN
jgi:hypothetical protein